MNPRTHYPPLPLDITLNTERLMVRRLRESDAGAIRTAALLPDAGLEQWIFQTEIYTDPDAVLGIIAESTLGIMQGSHVLLGAFSNEDGAFKALFEVVRGKDGKAGNIDIGFWAHPNSRGQGFTRETLVGISDYLLTQLKPDVQRVGLDCAVDNKAANALAQKAGFTLEGTKPAAYVNRAGDVQDCHFYGRVRKT